MDTSRILIVDDDAGFRKRLRESLGIVFRVEEAADEAEFRQRFQPFRFDLVLLDMRLQVDREGLDVLRWFCQIDPLQPVIMLSEFGNADAAIESVSAGAMMFLHKQEFTSAQLIRMAEAVIEQGKLRREAHALRDLAWRNEPDYLVGQSVGINEARQKLQSLAHARRVTAMVTGATGTGRSLVSRLLHRSGPRSSGPLVEVDSKRVLRARGPLSQLRQSEEWKKASLGTLVLDRVSEGSMPLIRELLEMSVEPKSEPSFDEHEPAVVGIADEKVWNEHSKATKGNSVSLEEKSLHLPPLRERREDIAVLATLFVRKQREQHGVAVGTVSATALERLEEHDWPGNVRELRNAIEFAALKAVANEDDSIETVHLPGALASSNSISSGVANWDYRFQISRAEVELLHQAIVRRGITVKTRMAKELGYSDRFTLLRRMRRAFKDYPVLAQEFPAVADLFLNPGRSGDVIR